MSQFEGVTNTMISGIASNCSSGQVLKADGSGGFTCAADAGSGGADASSLRGETLDTNLATNTTTDGQILVWSQTNNRWEVGTDQNTTYSAGTGLTLATTTFNVDVGTTSGKIVQLDATGLPAVDGSQLTGLTKTQVGLSNVSNSLQLLDSNKVTVIDGTSDNTGIPSALAVKNYVDGSAVTSLTVDQINSGAGLYFGYLPNNVACTPGQVLEWDNVNTRWVCGTKTVDTDTTYSAGTGLTLSTTTFNVDVGTGANQIIQLNGSAALPAVDGSNLTDVIAVSADSALGVVNDDSVVINADNTGDTTGDINFQINSTTQATLLNNGNFGIGTASPGSPLEVIGDIKSSAGQVWSANGSTATSRGLLLENYDDSVNTNGVDIGIKLGGSEFQGLSWAQDTAWTSASGTSAKDVSLNFGVLKDNVATQAMTLSSSGNLGLGTNSPGAKLHINAPWANGSAGQVILGGVGNAGNIAFMRPSDGSAQARIGWASQSENSEFRQFIGGGGSHYTLYTGGGERLRVTNNGNVGIGNTNPQVKLDVTGVIRAEQICDETGANCHDLSAGTNTSGTVTSVATGTGLTGGPITSTGTIAVDVGTTANKIPQLDGSGKLATSVETDPTVETFAQTTLPTCGVGEVLKGDGTSLTCVTDANTTYTGGTGIGIDGSQVITVTQSDINTDNVTEGSTNLFSQWLENGSSIYYNGGNVGIGTVNPSSTLDVNGGIKSYAFTTSSNGNRNVTIGSSGDGTYYNGLSIWSEYNASQPSHALNQSSGNGASHSYGRSKLSFIENVNGTPDTRMVINSGNVGIGTSTPADKLDVNGTARVTNLAIGASATVGGNTVFSIDDGRSFLRGTTSSSIFNVTSDVGGNSIHSVSNFRKVRNGSLAPQIGFGAKNEYSLEGFTDNAHVVVAETTWGWESTQTNDTTDRDGYFSISTTLNDTLSEKMRVTSGGNIGIGTSTPTTKLEVAGIVKATGFDGPVTATSSSVGNGTAASPSMTFSGDTNTGFFSSGADQIGVSVNGAKVFDFTSDGLVSNATGGASVARSLGSASAPTYSYAGDEDTGWYRPGADVLAASTGGSERIRISATGNIGIGTNSPSKTLAIQRDEGQTSGEHILTTMTRIAPNNNVGGLYFGYNANGTNDTGGFMRSIGGLPLFLGTLNSKDALFIADSGNIGIGTTSPDSLVNLNAGNPVLNIENTATTNGSGGVLRFGHDQASNQTPIGEVRGELINGSATRAGELSFWTSSAGTLSEQVRITETGNVGIGKSVPLEKLDVNGHLMLSGGGDGNYRINMQDGDGRVSHLWNTTGGTSPTFEKGGEDALEFAMHVDTSSNGGYRFRFAEGGAAAAGDPIAFQDLMVIKNDGNVGIGVSSPSEKLDVSGTVSAEGFVATRNSGNWFVSKVANNSNSAVFRFLDSNDNEVATIAQENMDGSGIGGLSFENADSYVFKDGNVGIGAATPGALFHVEGGRTIINAKNTTNEAHLTVGEVGNYGDEIGVRIYLDGDNGNFTTTGGDFPILVQTATNIDVDPIETVFGVDGIGDVFAKGNLGVGTMLPDEKAHIVGNLKVEGTVNTCTLGTGTGATNCTSDERLKDEVLEIENPLEKINQLRGVEFVWNERSQSPGLKAIGVIAQDIQKVFPTAVIENSDGFLSVDYAVLVAPLIAATKELSQNLEMYKLMNQGIESRVVKLERHVASLVEKNKKLEDENKKVKEDLNNIKEYLCLQNKEASFCKK